MSVPPGARLLNSPIEYPRLFCRFFPSPGVASKVRDFSSRFVPRRWAFFASQSLALGLARVTPSLLDIEPAKRRHWGMRAGSPLRHTGIESPVTEIKAPQARERFGTRWTIEVSIRSEQEI